MKAIHFQKTPAQSDQSLFVEVEVPTPTPAPHDLLVRVEAASINPVDTKVRAGLVAVPEAVDTLGWDVAGTVVARGSSVRLFKPGDAVFYAGTFTRPGANAELHVVDERIVGVKPTSLSFAEAAAMPLTSLTAWQLLFDRLQVPVGKQFGLSFLLVVGGAGGIGSILVQLARRLTGLTVIATASRPESADWCRQMGAHHVIDHRKPLSQQVAALCVEPVRYVAALTHTAQHLPGIVETVAPHGRIAVIDDHDFLDVAPLKAKSLSLHWEMVFTRPLFDTEDLSGQHRILNEVAALINAGVLRSTMTRCLSPFTVENLMLGHQLVGNGTTVGKVVVSYRTPAYERSLRLVTD